MKQRTTNDCGIVAVAVAANVSYATVKAKFGRLDRGGMELHEIDWLVREFGGSRCRCRQRPKLGRFVALYRKKSGEAHLSAIVDGMVHNPVEQIEKCRVEALWQMAKSDS